MDYMSVAEAKDLAGLRLVLSMGTPGPWGQAAKTIMQVKKIPFAAVGQAPGQLNEALKEWTGQNAAPVAVYDNERPRTRWNEILLLAERLSPTPQLIPADPKDRFMMMALCAEICDEDGLGWNRRELMIPPELIEAKDQMVRKYASGRSREHAIKRQIDGLTLLSEQFLRQRQFGSQWLAGSALSALDIYWTAFSVMLIPPSHAICPMADHFRAIFSATPQEVLDAIDPQLIKHRDRVFDDVFQTPMAF
jgi:glutathione S-transferase